MPQTGEGILSIIAKLSRTWPIPIIIGRNSVYDGVSSYPYLLVAPSTAF